jgi:hypothetical protein
MRSVSRERSPTDWVARVRASVSWRVTGLADPNLAAFLRFHGCLQRGGAISEALESYQARHGLPATGKLNWRTARLINAQRCSQPEKSWSLAEHRRRRDKTAYQALTLTSVAEGAEPELAPDIGTEGYEPIPARWSSRLLGFAFAGNPPPSAGETAHDAVRQAFSLWEAGGVLRFRERETADAADIRILWTFGPRGNPPSDDPFYGPGDKLAVGYFPYPHLGALAGDLHFDASEQWSVDGSGVDVKTVAVHEIGHTLGLGHCFASDSVMWPAYQKGFPGPTPKDFAILNRKYQGVPV